MNEESESHVSASSNTPISKFAHKTLEINNKFQEEGQANSSSNSQSFSFEFKTEDEGLNNQKKMEADSEKVRKTDAGTKAKIPSIVHFSEKEPKQHRDSKKKNYRSRTIRKGSEHNSKRISNLEEAKKKPGIVYLIGNIGRFLMQVYKVRQRLWRSKLENLTPDQMNVIKDYSYPLDGIDESDFKPKARSKKKKPYNLMVSSGENEVEIKRRIEKSIRKIIRNTLERIPLISPDGKFQTYWSVLLCLFIFYNFFTISLQLFFDECWSDGSEALLSMHFLLTLLSLLVFTIDIPIKINTGYYDDGVLIMSRRRIFNNYIRRSFWADIITLVPLILCPLETRESRIYIFISQKCTAHWLKLTFFIKLYEVEKIFSFFDEVLAINEKVESMLMLAKLMFNIILMIHIFACLWHLSAYYNKSLNWLIHLNLEKEPWFLRYVYSLYWSAATIITVGYGDVIPQNPMEVFLSIGAMIFGCGVFGYSLNNLGKIINKFSKSETELNRYMRRKNLDQSLQVRVKRYFEFIWNQEESLNEYKEKELLNKLSKSLREEVLVQTYGKVLAKYSLFCSTFSDELLIKTVHIMKTLKFSPEEPIFQRRDENSKQLYFVVEGEVELYAELQRPNERHFQALKVLEAGDIMGEKSFFTDKERCLNARSIGFSTIFSIDRDEFISVLKKFPSDYEKFCIIKDKLLLYKDSKNFKVSCYSCGDSKHFLADCPCLSYRPLYENIISRYIFSEEQTRYPYKRRRKRWCSALVMLSSVKRVCDKISPSPNTDLDLDMFPQMEEETIFEEEKDIDEDTHKKVSIKENTKSSRSFKSLYGDEGCEGSIRSNSTGLRRNRKSTPSLREDTNKLVFVREDGTLYENSNGSNNYEKTSYVTAKTLMTLKNTGDAHTRGEVFTRGVTSIDNNDKEDTKKSFTVHTSSGNTKRTDTNRIRGDSKKYMTSSDDIYSPMDHYRIDKIHNFIHYFPHNNCETILRYFEIRRRLNKNRRVNKKKKTAVNGLIDFDNQQRFFQKEVKSPARTRGLSPKSKRNNIFSLLGENSTENFKKVKNSKTML